MFGMFQYYAPTFHNQPKEIKEIVLDWLSLQDLISSGAQRMCGEKVDKVVGTKESELKIMFNLLIST